MIKIVIRQTWREELDHCTSPSSNKPAGSLCLHPTELHIKLMFVFIEEENETVVACLFFVPLIHCLLLLSLLIPVNFKMEAKSNEER